ncbi:MAG TPA: virulence factor [Candidatus Sulfomarinibacteraceae bacterium]|nr:virulence factor [Candidatus Sulfomarinibacteraceae bacterium]
MSVQHQVIYWRDVPAQVRVRRGRERASARLPARFQQTVYRAAFRAKAITGEPFEKGWRPGPWQTYQGPEEELSQIAAALAEALAAQYDEARLNELALNKGYSRRP